MDETGEPRLGVMLHAPTVDVAAVTDLCSLVASWGSVVVARAYADWTRPGLQGWFPLLCEHRIGLVQHFQTRPEHDPAMIALALDAVEVTRVAALDGVVLAGNAGSLTPVIARLHEAGARVVLAGPRGTPVQVRRWCDEFVYLDTRRAPTNQDRHGRHRA